MPDSNSEAANALTDGNCYKVIIGNRGGRLVGMNGVPAVRSGAPQAVNCLRRAASAFPGDSSTLFLSGDRDYSEERVLILWIGVAVPLFRVEEAITVLIVVAEGIGVGTGRTR